ncbi:VOC family protein [Reichenbachiella ulvae]|uniref:VOC family protein n=1 Tax=Reichenbachiella ulvae TaxID=2980104 RepID=A0ABT3CVU9_9BACT|nr:VOC family protein [Reichenbachiella ulvae]MCV9387836.1 VOC family protein [Reichenbachiella ulvae]
MLGLRTTIYKVDDIDEAKEWFAKAFETSAYFDESYYVGFNIAGYELGLIPDESITPKSSNVLSYWGVEDIVKEYEKFLALGARELEAPHNVGGEIIVAAVLDPWNNAVGLIYNPEFKLES